MANRASITRRAALIGAAASCTALAVPAVALAEKVNAASSEAGGALSDYMVIKLATDLFDHASFDRQQQFLYDLRAAGPDLAAIADVFERRRDYNWVWTPTGIPGLSVPSNA